MIFFLLCDQKCAKCAMMVFGNTKKTVTKDRLKNNARKLWIFVWNNYTDLDVVKVCQTFGVLGQYCFGKEVGDNGTRHLQGCIKLKKKIRLTGLKKLLPKVHWEVCRSWGHSVIYCKKDGDVFTNIPLPRKERMLNKFKKVVWKKWQQDVIDYVDGPVDPREILWLWEAKGNVGKSFLSKYLWLSRICVVADGKEHDVLNQVVDMLKVLEADVDINLVLLDVPRHKLEYINYGMLEKLKNGFCYSGKYEGGVVCIETPHLVVFANEPPDRSRMSCDRWTVRQICD